MTDYIQPGETRIKNSAVFTGLTEHRHEPILISIQKYIIEKYGAMITESYRPRLHINDLHGTLPVRALDNRIWCYPDRVQRWIEDEINNRWEYDPTRPEMRCAIVHSNRRGKGKHLHIQVHPGTRLRGYV